MTQWQRTQSPIDGTVYVERPCADESTIAETMSAAVDAQCQWRATPVEQRVAIAERFVQEIESRKDVIAEEITRQMGRPIRWAGGEVRGLAERARYMASIAAESLEPIKPAAKAGIERFIRREPIGVVLTIAAWNYPYLTAVNSILPALLSGNAVILKHSAQTPLCAERFAECLQAAGLPAGVFQYLHLDHAATERLVQDRRIGFVAFTGSVRGGLAIRRAAAQRFIGVGLELGGKDPAYVRADANLSEATEQLVDGAFFNSGQSCCAVERIYVHRDVFDAFVEGFAELTRQYRLGNPLDPDVTLGPLVRAEAAQAVREQIQQAISAGARALIDPSSFPADAPGTPYLAPQVLVDVDDSMQLMREETFGPAIGIAAVGGDEEAIERMNASRYGLTASAWTRDLEAAVAIGDRVETGTWYLNRCDYLDPALAWVGTKDSGHGCALSRLGFDQLTRPKSYHLKVAED